jgi:short-subunit dehydrogenase
MKAAVIVGASSGIGRELAKVLALNGYVVGLAGRRRELLADLQSELSSPSYITRLDVSKPTEAMALLRELIAEMNGVDLFVISAGTGFLNPNLDWQREKETIDVNVSGFTSVVNVAVEHLQARGWGHIVGISSLAALRGGGDSPAYNASKAFVSNYLEGLRHRFSRLELPIIVTDVQPGFVDTAMAKSNGRFWVASPAKAARQIFDAIQRRKKHTYVTRRWRAVAWLLKAMPDWLYNKL